MAGQFDKIRIAVVGDSGVGKTSLIYRLANQELSSSPPWTVGCSVEVFLHKYTDRRLGAEKEVFVELLDVGGSASHKKSRAIFYNSIQESPGNSTPTQPKRGIILVHDLSNRKSWLNLKKWLHEATNADRQELTGITIKAGRETEYQGDGYSSGNVPVLIVGTKLDQVSDARTVPSLSSIGLAGDDMVDTVNVVCIKKGSQRESFINQDVFDSFFNKIVKRKFFSRDIPDTYSMNNEQHDSPRSYLERKKKQRMQ